MRSPVVKREWRDRGPQGVRQRCDRKMDLGRYQSALD